MGTGEYSCKTVKLRERQSECLALFVDELGPAPIEMVLR